MLRAAQRPVKLPRGAKIDTRPVHPQDAARQSQREITTQKLKQAKVRVRLMCLVLLDATFLLPSKPITDVL